VFLLFNENSPHLSELGPDQLFFEAPFLCRSFLPFAFQDVRPSAGDRRVPFLLPENEIIGLLDCGIGLLDCIKKLNYCNAI
jgi:hypothetical protein